MGFGMKTCRVIWRVMRGLRICTSMSTLNLGSSSAIPCSPFRNRQRPYNLLVCHHPRQTRQLSLPCLPHPLRARWRVWDQMAKLIMTVSKLTNSLVDLPSRVCHSEYGG